MAKGYDKHCFRMQQLSIFGKDLTRRSKSKCELCSSGEKLSIYEPAPVENEVDYNNCIFICQECISQIDNPKKINLDHWRCLNTSIWSSVPVVQMLSVRMLQKLSDEPWARELLEQAYVDEEILAWAALKK